MSIGDSIQEFFGSLGTPVGAQKSGDMRLGTFTRDQKDNSDNVFVQVSPHDEFQNYALFFLFIVVVILPILWALLKMCRLGSAVLRRLQSLETAVAEANARASATSTSL